MGQQAEEFRMVRRCVALTMLLASATSVLAADAGAGKTTFLQQCALCHTAEPGDNGGAQGPDLRAIFDSPAASNAAFTYTEALRNAKLTWDAATLDRFLAAPTAVVPGSAMVIPVAQAADRENLIAYFQTLKQGAQSARVQGEAAPPADAKAGAD